ncbi:unnamed protein product, partial [Mesorhabditis belari]|uniref:ShKT domain-containing protein n=1 Tax=Mesorhabditis belari TaxID=2138241 RepID=A0AAF3F3Q7_9BILA
MKGFAKFFLFSAIIVCISADGTLPAFCISGPNILGCPVNLCDGQDGNCYCSDCDLTCGACKSDCTTTMKPITIPPTTPAPTTPVNPDCKDASANCAQWVPSGFCANPSYTDKQKKDYCAKSCGLCNCNDNSAQCDDWVKGGFCENPSYTVDQKKQYCALSCSLCSAGAATTPATTPGTCKDSSASCPTWVSNGFCTDPKYTPEQKKQYCAKSCNLC